MTLKLSKFKILNGQHSPKEKTGSICNSAAKPITQNQISNIFSRNISALLIGELILPSF